MWIVVPVYAEMHLLAAFSFCDGVAPGVKQRTFFDIMRYSHYWCVR
jgi:hypothetical protein